MLQTLHGLHNVAKYTHLNINTKNVMLRDDSASNWDRVRLLDFGLAQKCATGMQRQSITLDTFPVLLSVIANTVPAFASPESNQYRSMLDL